MLTEKQSDPKAMLSIMTQHISKFAPPNLATAVTRSDPT